jgi:hypothetical protein
MPEVRISFCDRQIQLALTLALSCYETRTDPYSDILAPHHVADRK